MGALEKIKIKKLKETIIQDSDKDIRTVITQYEQFYDGKSLYKVFAITKHDGELVNVVQSCITDNRIISDCYFSEFESTYPGSSITRKVF